MFAGCRELTSLDLSNFNTSKVESMYQMFFDCPNLETLDLSSFDITSTTSRSEVNTNSMFQLLPGQSNSLTICVNGDNLTTWQTLFPENTFVSKTAST